MKQYLSDKLKRSKVLFYVLVGIMVFLKLSQFLVTIYADSLRNQDAYLHYQMQQTSLILYHLESFATIGLAVSMVLLVFSMSDLIASKLDS